MYTIDTNPENSFTYALFGIQQLDRDQTIKPDSLIDTFSTLIQHQQEEQKGACFIDEVIQDGILAPGKGKTHIWIMTWKSSAQFMEWWTSTAVAKFWASLPNDAGMWREFLTIPYSRAQYKATSDWPTGLGSHYPHQPAVKNGYWGWIRDSIRETSRSGKEGKEREAVPRMDSNIVGLKGLDGQALAAAPLSKVNERIHITTFPDNICFNLERQDMSRMEAPEKEIWFNEFDTPVCQWMDDLAFAPPDAGIISSRMCYDQSSSTYQSRPGPVFHNYNKKVEPFYFTDLKAMEKSGMANKGHVALRNNILKTYGPGGVLSGGVGKMTLWVETSVLKASGMDAEYVGCVEGTGFMAYRDHEAFRNVDNR